MFTLLLYLKCYCCSGEVPKVSASYFQRIWFTRLGAQIVIRKCMRFALCDSCSHIQRRREMTSDRQSLLRIAREEKDHLNVVKGERTAYACRVREAHASGEDILSIAMDGADQGAYGLPYFCQVSSCNTLTCSHWNPLILYSLPSSLVQFSR